MITKIKKFFKESDSRYSGLVMLVAIYLAGTLSLTTIGAVGTIVDSNKTVVISIIDGTNEAVEVEVRERSLEYVLDVLEMNVSTLDEISMPLNQVVAEGDVVTINRVTYAQEEDIVAIAKNTVKKVDLSVPLFSTKVLTEGADGSITNIYNVKYVNGVETDRYLVDVPSTIQATDKVIGYSTVQAGAFFTGRLTRYGADCKGCSGRNNGGYGGTAAGLPVSVYGVNSNGTPYITYKGENYWVLAADPSIPFCTIIEVSNHKMKDRNGNSLGTFKGIVLDRGVYGTSIDLFTGGENIGVTYASGGTTYNTNYKILSVGSGSRYCYNK